ncbi:hypothetical protein [Glycomyces salinus]|uniref:hypothetical protein n=1 Tax=Glycomyces salinus TaxID=980294 RepID=UPI0018ED9BB6|nr:hypothetical protein [Glycomyces salinus]
MHGFKLVKGSEPASVYWRRRAIVAGAVIGLVLVAVLALKAIGGGSSSAQGDAEPQEWAAPSASSTLQRPSVVGSPPGASPSPEETAPSEPPVPECGEDELMLQVVAAFEEARSGSEVPVSVLVASGDDEACTVAMDRVEVELAAGEDVVYSTAHCDQAEERTVELAAGEGETAEFRLDGRASEAGCSGERRTLPAGDYDLRARLGEAESRPAGLRLN